MNPAPLVGCGAFKGPFQKNKIICSSPKKAWAVAPWAPAARIYGFVRRIKMNKYFLSFCCLVLSGAAFALPEKNAAEVESSVRAALREAEAPCTKGKCFDEAVLEKNIRRIENTLTEAENTPKKLKKWLSRTVKMQPHAVSVPEYLIAQGELDGAARLLPWYADYYARYQAQHAEGWADNLLEKLALHRDHPSQLSTAQTVTSAAGVKKVSRRTFAYAASQADTENGYKYVKFLKQYSSVADFSGAFSRQERDEHSVPMPFALPNDYPCGVLNIMSETADSSQTKWINRSRVVFKCPVVRSRKARAK